MSPELSVSVFSFGFQDISVIDPPCSPLKTAWAGHQDFGFVEFRERPHDLNRLAVRKLHSFPAVQHFLLDAVVALPAIKISS